MLAERQLPPGSFSSPVKIANLNLEEKGFGEMEKPVFISKNQKNVKSQNNQANLPLSPETGLSQPIDNDIVKTAMLGKKKI